ncbi:unnamed protein product [Caenorhabditis bovis]|uniref:Protein RFT1 homolog n=1 Tax=Caenorhabditis bovis TaxID=2654633 RepID=A0A8S1F3A4_9PELO|nr:unnamed protein product [Caenorhabditis bovis]
MSSLVKSFGYNVSGQLFARIISFAINMYLLRVINNDVIGLVNVRLNLMYSTILFLTREPMRKANIDRDSVPQFVNILWLSPIIATILSVICLAIWSIFSTTSENVSLFVLLSFPLSSIIEAFAEPFATISLRYSLGRHFAIGQGVLICMKRIFVFAALFILPNVYHLDLFAYAQYFGSIVYLIFHVSAFLIYMKGESYPELEKFQGFRSLLPDPSQGVDTESVKAVSTMFSHSILKQFIAEGSAYVMTFTELLSLKQQAVYDAVERIGSLVARAILAPLEENGFAYFSNAIHKQSTVFNKSTKEHDELIKTLSNILHIAGVIGFVACAFGVPYSPTAIYLYGGDLLYSNGGSVLLSLYSIYLFIMAVNGITECFAMASMNNREVLTHGSFLLLTALGQLFLNFVLCYYFNSPGFIIANIVTMMIRIGYSWRHISNYLGPRTPSFFTILPTFDTITFIFASFFATSFSYLIFGTTPGLSYLFSHLAIGAVLFSLLAMNIAQHDPVFANIVNSYLKPHNV